MIPFSQIIGQDRAKKFLKQAMQRDKLPHAYLFTGMPGVGKTTTAMALSMALNCKDPVEWEGCGRCPACRQMVSGNFPDFLPIGPDGQYIKIAQIRELNRTLAYGPVSGKYRMCVIHQAESMNREAANSFLKTLEEPPQGNIFILNTVEPRDLLPTIVSRCQRLSFQPLSLQDIADWLSKKMGVSDKRARMLAKISGGSLGSAIHMSETDFPDKRQEWIHKFDRLPSLSRNKAFLMAIALADEAKEMTANASEAGRVRISDMVGVWASWYRDLLLLKVQGAPRLLINDDFDGQLKKAAEKFTVDQLVESLVIIDRVQRDLQRNLNVSLVIQSAALHLRRLASTKQNPAGYLSAAKN